MIEVEDRTDRIVVRAEIGAPRDRVWRALTDEGRIAEWWGDHVSVDAHPGGRQSERWTDISGREVLTSGEVVRLDAPRTLELTWADDDWEEPTRTLFRLEAAGHSTRLTLEHSGWEAFPPSTRGRLVRAHASGWSDHMANLADYSVRTPR